MNKIHMTMTIILLMTISPIVATSTLVSMEPDGWSVINIPLELIQFTYILFYSSTLVAYIYPMRNYYTAYNARGHSKELV